MMQSDRAGSLNQEGRKPPARTPSNDPPSKISKRKRTNPQASPSANPTEFPKKFEFIVGNDDKARKNARVHVMKEFMRKKRFEETGHADEEPSSSSHKKKGRRRRSDKRPSSEPLQTLSPTSDHALPSASTPLGNVGTVGNVVHNVDPNQAYVAGPSTSLPYRPELGPLSIPQTSPSYAASIPTPYASTALTTPMGHNFIPEPTYTYDASLPNTTATSYYAADLYQQNPLVDSLDAWSAAVQWRSTPDPGLRLEAYGAKRLVYERRPEGEEDNAQWEEVQDVQSAQWHYPSPQTVVGAVRKDPFDCYPLPVTQEDHELVDHLIRVMPTNFHSLAPRPDHHFQYFRDMIFRPAIDGPLSFQVMVLAFAAGNIEWTRRRPGDSALALKHKVRVGHIMNGRLKSNPNDCSDEMIMAVLGLAACEDINPTPHSKEKSWVHFRTAMQLVRNRGGPAAFAHNRRLTLHINYLDYRMAGYQRTGFTFSGLPPPKSNDPNDSTVNPKQELETYTAEFIDVLASLHSLASASNTVSCKTTQPRRHSLFKPGTPLHRLLSTPPSMRRGIPGFRIQVIARFVALLYINLTFWDLRDDVMASEGFLKTLALRIVEYDLDTSSSSIEMLVHLLILGFEDDGSIDGSDFNNLHHIVPMVEAERPWKIGRLLKVAKRLSRSSWDKLNEILLRMLAQADFGAGFTGIAGGTKSWLGGLETEILEAEDEALVAPAIE